ncbi:hypothetical protein HYR69_08950 [Candidatus Sumerlaeota bacterium]|nr:hypothetical protein [Candidatus Sumerlaeota bacterium]MBI3736275.1 hypothetical protein [Candidatus Sumerlaeota bacterium]
MAPLEEAHPKKDMGRRRSNSIGGLMAAALAGVVLCSGCNPKLSPEKLDAINERNRSKLVGTWFSSGERGKRPSIRFLENGNFEADHDGDAKIDAWGNYFLKSGEIKMSNTLGERCLGVVGVYHFRFIAGSLRFSLVEDQCEMRRSMAGRFWTKD